MHINEHTDTPTVQEPLKLSAKSHSVNQTMCSALWLMLFKDALPQILLRSKHLSPDTYQYSHLGFQRTGVPIRSCVRVHMSTHIRAGTKRLRE